MEQITQKDSLTRGVVLYIKPLAKPRMVRSDAWANRPCVLQYWEYKGEILLRLKQLNYHIKKDCRGIDVTFYFKAKSAKQVGKDHTKKPDLDNLLKALLDILLERDQGVVEIRASKYYSDCDKIVFTLY